MAENENGDGPGVQDRWPSPTSSAARRGRGTARAADVLTTAGVGAAAVAAGAIFAWTVVGVARGGEPKPPMPATRLLEPSEHLAPACAERLEGCPDQLPCDR